MQRFNYDQITSEPLLYYGLIKHVEIIGEAIYMLSKEFKEEHPEVEWQTIADLRHILVHDYYRINSELLKPIIETDVPELRDIIKQLHDGMPDSDS